MIFLVTCNKYQIIESIHISVSKRDVVARCKALEQSRNDGYAVMAMQYGRIVADSEGWHGDRYDRDDQHYRDQIDRACGYLQ